jgi:hypothetical protein
MAVHTKNGWHFALSALAIAGAGLMTGCDDDKSSSNAALSVLECEKAGVPNKETQPAKINKDLVGTYDLVYMQNSKGGPFEEGDTVTAVIGADNSLEIAGKKYCDPFLQEFGGTPNDFEVIWYDTETEIGFALTDNVGGKYSEINVGDYGNPTGVLPEFLGQLREAKK